MSLRTTTTTFSEPQYDASVIMETDVGMLVVDLLANCDAALNFLRLCEVGYFRNNLFFKIERNFIAMGGDPTGTGENGQSFNEILQNDNNNQNIIRIGQNQQNITNDSTAWKGYVLCALLNNSRAYKSQFFLTLDDASTLRYNHIRDKHMVIGRIVTDEEDSESTLKKLSELYVDSNNRPLKDVRFRQCKILVYPKTIEKLHDDFISQEFKKHVPNETLDVPQMEWDQIEERYPFHVNDDELSPDQKTQEDLLAENRAVKLEILGDLTSADARPDENVLFVCKLNPLTKSEDLELIFSRFGEVKKCDVKKDYVTGDSLQYAFVEFADRKQCEEAYKKMQGVVVDGRRIHVDFSQSENKRFYNNKTSSSIFSQQPQKDTNIKQSKSSLKNHRHHNSESDSDFSTSSSNQLTKKKHKKDNYDTSDSSNSSAEVDNHDKKKKKKKEKRKKKDKKKKRKHS